MSGRIGKMLSRRNFLNAGLGASASSILPMQASRPAAAQPARRLIVDAQVHLWKAETADWPFVPGLKPQLPEPMTVERLLPMMDEAGVDRVVAVPPSWVGDRNDYGLEAASRYPNRFHVMGRIPLQNPQAAAALLPKWKEQPGMLGVRLTFLAATTSWLSDGTADWFWPAAEKAQVPVMFFAPGQVAKFAAIAERHPQLTLILDHMGLTASMLKDNTLATAVDQAVALAKYPNVSVKLSASPGISTEPYPFRDVTIHLKRVFEAYGPRRSYWGTDMTNSFAKASYRQRVTHFTEELDFLSESDKDWVMGRAILARLNWS
jgi:predicted TIM-barrel fold metal-dependent hydrolase